MRIDFFIKKKGLTLLIHFYLVTGLEMLFEDIFEVQLLVEVWFRGDPDVL